MEPRAGALFCVLSEINEVFAIGHDSLRPKAASVGAAFFPSVCSSFLAATNLAMSLHLTEAYKPLRGCLESAAYTLHAERDLGAYGRWKARPAAATLSRDLAVRKEQMALRRRSGSEYSATRIAGEISDLQLRERFLRLYEETIDEGAHYNFPAFKRDFEIVDRARRAVRSRILSNSKVDFVACLMKIGDVSLTSLRIVDLAFVDQWNSVLIRSRIEELQHELEDCLAIVRRTR